MPLSVRDMAHIHVTRIGYGETEYDLMGEQAPITWICGCGSRLTLEWFDDAKEQYFPVSDDRKQVFLEKHSACTVMCWECHRVPVERVGCWCDACVERQNAFEEEW